MKEDIFDLKLFQLAAKLGSISQAGSSLNLSRTAASKRIATLENKFGGHLLIRSKEGISLTERGRSFYEDAEVVLTQYYDLLNRMGEKTREREAITILTTHALSSFYLPRALAFALKEIKNINVEVIAKDQLVEIHKEQADVYLLSKHAELVGYSQEKLFERYLALFASKDYLNRYGTPKKFKDLASHRIIIYGKERNYPYGMTSWPIPLLIEHGIKEPNYIAVNSVDTMIKLSEEGAGIIGASIDLAKRFFPNLVHILNSCEQESTTVHLITSNRSLQNARKANFIKLLKQSLRDNYVSSS